MPWSLASDMPPLGGRLRSPVIIDAQGIGQLGLAGSDLCCVYLRAATSDTMFVGERAIGL